MKKDVKNEKEAIAVYYWFIYWFNRS